MTQLLDRCCHHYSWDNFSPLHAYINHYSMAQSYVSEEYVCEEILWMGLTACSFPPIQHLADEHLQG